MAIRVALAEDSLLVRAGIEQLLRDEGAVEVVAACGDLPSLLAAVEEHGPDVVLTDVRMPPTGTDEGIRAAVELRTLRPRVGVVVLSQYAEPRYLLALMAAGSERRAYLLKERIHDRAQLVAAVTAVAHGGSFVDARVVELLVAAREREARSPLAELTPRERDVLALMAQGRSNAAIAAVLVLTKRAVEKHVNAIFMKLGLTDAHDVSKRVAAALLFLGEQSASR